MICNSIYRRRHGIGERATFSMSMLVKKFFIAVPVLLVPIIMLVISVLIIDLIFCPWFITVPMSIVFGA